MNCKDIREQFALLLYGELSFDEEERIDSHLDGCAECRAALARQKVLHEAVDAAAVTPSPALLNRCREDLAEMLPREKTGCGHGRAGGARSRVTGRFNSCGPWARWRCWRLASLLLK